MKNVIQNVVGVVVVAVSTYAGAIYGIEHSMYRTPASAVIIDSPVVPTCQEVYSGDLPLQTCSGGVEAIPQELVEMVCNAHKYQGEIHITFNGAVVRCYK